MPDADDSPEALIALARGGDPVALGRLLERYRNYLRLIARSVLGVSLKGRVDESDLVQETFVEAHREFGRFAGGGEPELAAWLRRILVQSLTDLARHHRSRKRDVRKEESLEAALERSGLAAHRALASAASSPSARAIRREQAVLLADALARLPDAYREVILLRNMEHVPFEEVAARMGRSPGASRMLWTRAIEALNRILEAGS